MQSNGAVGDGGMKCLGDSSNAAVGDDGFCKIQWLPSQTVTLCLTSVNSLPCKLIIFFFQIYHSHTKLFV